MAVENRYSGDAQLQSHDEDNVECMFRAGFLSEDID